MAAKWLLNSINLARGVLTAGSSIEDTEQAEVESAGGVLFDKGNSTVDNAAAECERLKLRGAPPERLESVMQSAVNKKQEAALGGSSAAATATNQATTATNQSTSVFMLVCIPGSALPAEGVAMHAQINGGAALDVSTGFTSPLPARNAVITRSDAGPASVDYTLTWELPDGTTVEEVIAAAKNAATPGVKAGKLVSVTTEEDPVSTTDIDTGNRVSIGSPIVGTPVISIDGVREALAGATDAATGTVEPTTALDGTKSLSVLAQCITHNHVQDAHNHTQNAHTHSLA